MNPLKKLEVPGRRPGTRAGDDAAQGSRAFINVSKRPVGPSGRRLRGACGASLVLLTILTIPSWSAWWSSAIDPLKPVRADFEAGRFARVVSALSPTAMQKLRGQDLRQAYFYLAASHERGGRLDEALGVYQLATKLYPKDAGLLVHQARIMHETGLEEQAQPLYEKILKLQPDNAHAHRGLAEIDRALGFLDRAAEHYELALEKLSSEPGVWRDYAEVLYDRREYKTASLAARKALSLSPDAESFVVLAMIQRASGELGEAIATLQSLGRTPGVVRALALFLLEAGRFEDARRETGALLALDAADPLGLYLKARLDWKAGRPEAAAKSLASAAASGKAAPFLSQVSAALLEELKAARHAVP